MTLSIVPRYDRHKSTTRGDRAVVVGAGYAGLCAARVLADYFDTVTVLDRDPLRDSPDPRRGVPQDRHPHMLRLAGARVIEDLLPGYADAVEADGGVEIASGSDLDVFALGGFWASPATPYTLVSASRPLFEQVLRRRVLELDGVRLRPSHQFLEYLTDEHMDVRGVTVQKAADEVTEITADLVVDATGRTTRTPTWLEEHGYAAPPVDEVEVDVAYSTCLLERPPGATQSLVVLPDDQGRAALVIPAENDQWFVTLIGRGEDHPPTDPDEFVSYAEELPVSDVGELLDEHDRVSEEIDHYPFASNRRYRYEELDEFPGGLAVIGDAIASFNPTYAQGMSVAAMEATVLHDVLADYGVDDVGMQLVERADQIIETPWFLAVAFDSLFPETSGPVPDGVDSYREFIAHVARVIHDDGEVSEAFLRVSELERSPSSLLSPAVARRVFGPQETDGHPEGIPSWVPSSMRDAWPLIDEQLGLAEEVRTWPGFSTDATTESVSDD